MCFSVYCSSHFQMFGACLLVPPSIASKSFVLTEVFDETHIERQQSASPISRVVTSVSFQTHDVMSSANSSPRSCKKSFLLKGACICKRQLLYPASWRLFYAKYLHLAPENDDTSREQSPRLLAFYHRVGECLNSHPHRLLPAPNWIRNSCRLSRI